MTSDFHFLRSSFEKMSSSHAILPPRKPRLHRAGNAIAEAQAGYSAEESGFGNEWQKLQRSPLQLASVRCSAGIERSSTSKSQCQFIEASKTTRGSGHRFTKVAKSCGE